MNYWLLKSEPDSFGIDDLAAAPKKTAVWDGVRNFQARNMLRDSMKKGDQAFFYHSSCEVPGIAGIVSVVKEGYPDKTADDPSHHHYDEKNRAPGSSGEPRWYVVDVKLVRKFKRIITLDQLRIHQSKALRDLVVLRRGNRLSVTPVTKKDWLFVLSLE
jgi:predicted RNA-binding protein with PUA-like domain